MLRNVAMAVLAALVLLGSIAIGVFRAAKKRKTARDQESRNQADIEEVRTAAETGDDETVARIWREHGPK